MQDPLERLAELTGDPGCFDFYAALRLLECMHPALPRIGQSQRPQDDAVRFGQPPSVAFEAGMLGAWRPGANGGAPRLEVPFFGLLGASGPLPLHISEYVRDRLRNGSDPTLSRFLDMFHHRMTALFYRAWASAQPAVSLDRPGSDRFSDYVASLIGLGMASLRQRDAVPDFAKQHYAGLLALQVRSAGGLAQLLEDFFKFPVAVQEFRGHWMALPSDSQCHLRSTPDAGMLGMSTVLGTKVWNCQHKFRIVAGPLSMADFRRLLPGGASFRRLLAWVRNYAGLSYDWELQLLLKQEQVPGLRLGKQSKLGWTTWMQSLPSLADDGQLVIQANHHAA
jgi:type VI secretion system protein ImpH